MSTSQYYARPITPSSDKWHVIAPDGFPIYDDAPDGKDKPKVFDEDRAFKVAQELNAELATTGEQP